MKKIISIILTVLFFNLSVNAQENIKTGEQETNKTFYPIVLNKGCLSANIMYNEEKITWDKVGPIINSLNDKKASSDFKTGKTVWTLGMIIFAVGAVMAFIGLKQSGDAVSEETPEEVDKKTQEANSTRLKGIGIGLVGGFLGYLGGSMQSSAVERYNNIVTKKISMESNTGYINYRENKYFELSLSKRF